MFNRVIATLAATLALVGIAAADPTGHTGSAVPGTWLDPGWRRTITTTVTVDEDGSRKTVIDFAYRALDETGARHIAQAVFDYDSYFDTASLVDLATVKADGRVIPVDERAIGDQAAGTDTSSPYFDESRTVFAAFPDVAAGDTVKGRLIKTSKRPQLDGAFASYWMQPADEPPGVMDLTLDVPAAMPLHVAAHGVVDAETRKGDRVIHHVTFTQDAPKAATDGIDGFDGARRFEASTFTDYAAFAATMKANNAPMAVPDATVIELAATIVGDAATPAAKVERIHDWVARNIRYVGLGFQNGGLTSQPAAAVLAARYGDCKAHATLLKALLAAQAIEADFVVVNAGPHFTITELATPNFDHAIVFVPELGRYLDPTASSIAFGALPRALYGKPALDIDRGTLATIPVLSPEDFALAATTDYTLRPDGTRQAHSVLSGSGLGDAVTREAALWLATLSGDDLARDRITAAGLIGKGSYSFPNAHDLGDRFAIDAPFDITSALDMTGPNLIRMFALTDPRPTPGDLALPPRPAGDFVCSSLRYDDIASLTLPDGINLYQKPGDLSYERTFGGQTAYGAVTGHVELTRSARLSDHLLRSDSHLILAFSAPVCPHAFAEQIRTALKTFDTFMHQPVGITPHAVTSVVEGGSAYEAGVTAYKAGHYDKAILLWMPLAEKGDLQAANWMGTVFQEGRGVPQDYGEAFRWYLRSAAAGDALAESHIGYFYGSGLGVARNDERAAFWYRRSAEQGFAYAEYNFARLLVEGQGMPHDPAQAVAWYEKAASQNDLDARTMLGLMYEHGNGVELSYEKAAAWYRGAAEKGNGLAQLDLGLLYASGHGLARDYGAAADWFRKSSDRGFAGAQFNLGWMYENGLGVPKDTAQAIAWYAKAATSGHAAAEERLESLSKPASSGDAGMWSGLVRSVGALFP